MAYSQNYSLQEDIVQHEELHLTTHHDRNMSYEVPCRQISLICKICERVMKEPTTLPCLHSFCYSCLIVQFSSSRTILCYECKRKHLIENIKKDLLPNFPVQNCIDAQAVLGIISCAFCSKTNPLVSTCIDCGSYICILCETTALCSSNRLLLSRIQIDIMKSDEDTCDIHPKEILMHYCSSCDTPICKECIERYHENENHVVTSLISIQNILLEDLRSSITEKEFEMSKSIYPRDIRDELINYITTNYQHSQHIMVEYLNNYLIKIDDISKEFQMLYTMYSTISSRLKELAQLLSNGITYIRHIHLFYVSLQSLAKPIHTLLYKTAIKTNLEQLKFKELHEEFNYYENTFIDSCILFVRYLENMKLPDSRLTSRSGSINRHPNPGQAKSKMLLVNLKFFNNTILLQRTKIKYVLRFGSAGTNIGEFLELNGIAVTDDNTIIVPDSNNHRIQVFNSAGAYIYSFGEDNVSLPNLVAISRKSGNIIISERFPRHRINVYTMTGTLLHTFGKEILLRPRAITTDHEGRVIIVESKLKRVHIFTEDGEHCLSFGCPDVEFPVSVDVNKDKMFIADNKNHDVKVYNYQGTLERGIGGKGITNYPIAVKINETGDVVVADNHDNMKLTIFNQDGELITGYSSKIRQNQCLDFAFMRHNSIAITCVDRQVYVYEFPYKSFENNESSMVPQN